MVKCISIRVHNIIYTIDYIEVVNNCQEREKLHPPLKVLGLLIQARGVPKETVTPTSCDETIVFNKGHFNKNNHYFQVERLGEGSMMRPTGLMHEY